jgi:alpha-L-fucosidase
MKVNGAAIYGTRAAKIFRDGDTWFTKAKNKDTMYALVCLPEGKPVSKELVWRFHKPAKGSKITLLQTGEEVKWIREGNGIKVFLPATIVASKESYPALAFAFTAGD